MHDASTSEPKDRWATCINAIALEDAFSRAGLDAVAMSAVEMDTFADH